MPAPRVADFDPSPPPPHEGRRRERHRLQLELLRMENRMRDEASHGFAVVFEGVDAAGKGGAIARLVARLDPRGVAVHSIGAPSGREQREQYLARFHARMPARGEFAVFDRSWYGRVLVERVEGFASPAEVERAYREIREFERHYADANVAVLKIWLQISREEQLRRFEQRGDDPFKRYKLTSEDWRNRDHWDDYVEAADEMFARTHTEESPWLLLSGEHKRHARHAVLRAVHAHVRRHLGWPETPPAGEGG